MNISWVGQEDSNGCSLACLAMILGKSYQEIKADFLYFENKGVSFFSYDHYLAENGFAVARKYRHYQIRREEREIWPVEPFADVHICTVRIDPDFHHTVILLKDGLVLDPLTQEKRTLADYSEIDNIAGVYKI
jgi:hypothetical protein